MKKLTGKKIVVIGGSRGTGLAIVKALDAEGADVLVIARTLNSLTTLKSSFPNVHTLMADATEDTTASKVFEGAPDMVVLVAGAIPPTRAMYELDWEAFSMNWEMDVKASFLLAKYALTTPVKLGTQIIFISSGAGIGGSPISGGYAGAKRTQMFLANYAQQASDRLKLGLRFLTLVPWRLMKGTTAGDLVVPKYAAFNGIPEEDFVARMTNPQTKEDVAEAIVAYAIDPPAAKEGNVFIVSGKGLVAETKMREANL